jgi:sugar transferase (PEP-CTERM/EpsH1 system associated)
MIGAVTTARQQRRPILFVNNSMAMGGIETVIVDLVRQLPRDELVPYVAVFESGGSLEPVLADVGVPVCDLGKRAGVDFRMVANLRRLLRARGVEVVHSHDFSPWLYTTLAVCSLRGSRIVHVHTEHSPVDYARRRYLIERLLGAMTTHVVAVSAHVRNVMVDEIGFTRGRVRLVYNGIDTGRFSPDTSVRDRVRSELGIGDNEIVVGIVGRLVEVKDHVTLLQTFAELVKRQSQALRLMIVGEGPERARIVETARVLGVGDRIALLGERRDVADLLNAMDIYALSSRSEGMNLTLLEAMGCCLPVVATSVGGNVEIVVDGKTGLLVPPARATAFVLALERLIVSSELRRDYGNQGRERVLRNFSHSAMVEAYRALYRG